METSMSPSSGGGLVTSTPAPCTAGGAAALLVTERCAAGEAKDTATAGGVLRTREVGRVMIVGLYNMEFDGI